MNLEQKFNWKIQKLEQAYAKEHRNPELALRLAEAYFQKGYYLGKGDDWFELAIERVSEAIDQGLVTSEACTLLANALYGRHEYDAAGQAYRRAIELDPRNALAHVGLGNLEKRRGDFPKARECFQRASDLQPSLWQAHYNLGGAFYQEARVRQFRDSDLLLEKAVYHLIRALQLDPFENFVGNIHKDLGEIFLHTGQYQRARPFFTRLLSHERYRPFAHYYLGLANYHLGKFKLAIQNFRNFLKCDPTSAVAHARIGLAYLDLQEHRRARLACNRALELDPANILALFTLGCTYYDQRQYSDARRLYERALEVDPNYFPAYVELIKACTRGRDHEWLLTQLREELTACEGAPGYDGGPHHFQGKKGLHRRRLEVLLLQLRDKGQRAFPILQELLERARTDSLRFQIWGELYAHTRKARIDALSGQLRDLTGPLTGDMGRTALQLAPHLPEHLLIPALDADDQRLKAAAQSLMRARGTEDFSAAHRHVRAEFLEFQSFAVKALAEYDSAEARSALERTLQRPERGIRLSAALPLGVRGHAQALEILQDELELAPTPADRERIRGVLETGRRLARPPENVIVLGNSGERRSARDSAPARHEESRPPTPTPAPVCAICGKGQREVERMLAGNKLMICTGCIRDLWHDRDMIRATEQKDLHCSFCKRSIYQVDAFYSRASLLMCDRCLELSLGVIEREEVDRYLSAFD